MHVGAQLRPLRVPHHVERRGGCERRELHGRAHRRRPFCVFVCRRALRKSSSFVFRFRQHTHAAQDVCLSCAAAGRSWRRLLRRSNMTLLPPVPSTPQRVQHAARHNLVLGREAAAAFYAEKQEMTAMLDAQVHERDILQQRRNLEAKARRRLERRKKRTLANQLAIEYGHHSGPNQRAFVPIYGNTHGFRCFSDIAEGVSDVAIGHRLKREQEGREVTTQKEGVPDHLPPLHCRRAGDARQPLQAQQDRTASPPPHVKPPRLPPGGHLPDPRQGAPRHGP